MTEGIPGRRRSLLVGLTFSAIAAVGSVLAAATARAQVALDWRVPTDCAPTETMTVLVEERLGHPLATLSGAPPYVASVTIEEGPPRVLHFALRCATGEEIGRRVLEVGGDCRAEDARAAIILSLLVETAEASEPEPVSSGPTATAEPPGLGELDAQPAMPDVAEPPARRDDAPPEAALPDVAPGSPRLVLTLRAASSVQRVGHGFIGGAIEVGVRVDALILSAEGWAGAAGTVDSAPGIRGALAGGSVRGCGMLDEPGLLVGACAALLVGAAVVRGTNLPTVRSALVPLVELAASARLAMWLTDGLALDLEIGALVPLLRAAYTVDGSSVHEPWPVSPVIAVGVRWEAR